MTCDGETLHETDLSFGDNYSYTADKEGSYVFTAYVRDGNETQVSASSSPILVMKGEAEELKVSVTADQSSAKVGDTISATATATGGDGHYSFEWAVNGNTLGETGSTGSFTPEEAGSYTFTVTVTDGNGATATESSSAIIVEDANGELRAFVDVNTTTAMLGESLEASATATGGDGNYKFAWKITKDDEEIHTTDASIGPKYSWPADEAGTYVFTVTVVDGEGTTATADGAPIVVTECQHENTKEIELEAPIYTNNGDSGHTRTVKVRIECVDCGAVVVEETIVSRPEAHDFSNGPCPCGQSNHVHHYEKVEIQRSDYVNETTEKHKVTITYVERCTGCGDQSEEKTEVVFENHIPSSYRLEREHHEGEGHKEYYTCVCGAKPYTGRYGKRTDCCACTGKHDWGEPFEENGKWYHECKNGRRKRMKKTS